MTTIATAAREYASRPKDERYPSLDALIAVAAEDKQLSRERGYNLHDLTVAATAEGLRLRSGRGEAEFTHWSFGQLSRAVGAPAGFLRDGLTPDLAADVLNHRISEQPPTAASTILVRAANGHPVPTVRSITSESYGRVWDADLYGSIARMLTDQGGSWQLPPTWSGEPAGAYRGDRDSFLIVVNGGSIVTDPSLRTAPAGGSGSGDPSGLYRGLLVRNSEVGASSVTIESILYRFVCGNHMLWGATIDRSFRRRHVGVHALRDTIREIGQIAVRWGNRSAAQDEALIHRLMDLELAATRDGVIAEGRSLGLTAEQAAAAYDRCVQTEAVSPRSFWGLAQGVTRISQDSGYQGDRYALDQIAGLILARGAKVAA